jgi:hypothetical protein
MRANSLSTVCRFLAAGALVALLPTEGRASDAGLAQRPAPPSLLIPVAPEGPPPNWIDHFDTYTTGSEVIGQGGWEGWAGDNTVGALTSSAQARSASNSIDVLGDTDLVHQFTGYTSGTWTVTAWQYVPAAMTAQSYFIVLNTYPASSFGHWSFQFCFDGAANLVRDDTDGTCGAASTTTLLRDQWVEIKVVIDLTADTQTAYYNGTQFFSGPWSTHLGPEGTASLRAIDIFANGATSVFWDDLSVSNLPFSDGFEDENTQAWHQTIN